MMNKIKEKAIKISRLIIKKVLNIFNIFWSIKPIRIIAKTAIVFLILINMLNIALTYFYYYKDPLVDWSYRYLFNSVLGMPYYEEYKYRNDAEDIVKFSKEEWMRFKCKPRGTDFNSKTGYFKGIKDHLPEDLSPSERLQLNCIGIDAFSPYADRSTKTINGELCSNLFNCQIINLGIKDYVLEKPEILWNILRIAENPCKYIKQPEEGKSDIEKLLIERARENIGCYGNYTPWYMKKKIFILISIWNSKNKQIAEFIVRRKDI